jgi:spore coat polysaccharide biosynthesis protein SpsF
VRTAVIVQARTGSSRMPGKVLKPLGGRTVLEEVLRRARAIAAADGVVCAIPDLPEDDRLVPLATKAGAEVVRGSALDVLSRYRRAAEAVGAEIVLRVTADCPLIDPALCSEVLRRRRETGADYVTNDMPPSFPQGLDCEAFTTMLLRLADATATESADREHVTPWMRRSDGISRADVTGPGGRFTDLRWTLDYPEDYEFLRAVFALLPPPPAIPAWREVAEMIEKHPAILAINAARRVRRG